MEKIIAKFNCDEVKQLPRHEEVKMSVVTGATEENKSFSRATPTGSLQINIDEPKALGFFKAGKQYLLTFEEAALA